MQGETEDYRAATAKTKRTGRGIGSGFEGQVNLADLKPNGVGDGIHQNADRPVRLRPLPET